MIIVSIKEFKDKTSAKKKEEQTLVPIGTLINCDEKLALERIKKGFAIKVLNPEILIPKAEESNPSSENGNNGDN